MAAIITDDFRKNNIEKFIKDVANPPTTAWSHSNTYAIGDLAKHNSVFYRNITGNNGATSSNDPSTDSTNWVTIATEDDTGGKTYYLGIGKTETWLDNANGAVETDSKFTVPFPTGSIIEKSDVKKNLITLIKVEATDCQRLVPQIEFQTGRKYKVYNPFDPTCFDTDAQLDEYPCYALYTDALGHRKIYLCLGNNNGGVASQNIPAMDQTEDFPFGIKQNATDKYIWAFVDYFDKAESNLFRGSQTFFPVTPDTEIDSRMNNVIGHGTGNSTTGAYLDGRMRASRVSAGLLYGFHIDPNYKGKKYTANRFIANGTNLTAKIVGERLDGTRLVGTEVSVKVETNQFGEISNIEWDLNKAKALGYGIASVPASKADSGTGNTGGTGGAPNWTGMSVTNNGGIKEATLIISDPSGEAESGFEEANVQPLIAPKYGFGWSPELDLPSYYCGISADFKGTVGDDSDAPADNTPAQYVAESLVNVNFRQVSLIRDTEGNMSRGEDDLNSDGTYPDSDLDKDKAMNCLQYIQIEASEVPNALNNLASGAYLIQEPAAVGEESPMAWVDQVSRYESGDPAATGSFAAGGYRIYFHQNSDKRINQLPLTTGKNITIYDNTGTAIDAGTLTAGRLEVGEYEQDTGDVMFIDNRAPIKRNSQQTEEVRLIIQF